MELNNLQERLKSMQSRFTPEYLKQLARQAYDDDRAYPENFSNWYPQILDFGKFKHAKVISNQVFTFEESEKLKATDQYSKVDWNELEQILKPTLDKLKPYELYNIKNGCFSNKFDFTTCMTLKSNLVQNFWKINYQSALFETGGDTEIVVREHLLSNLSTTLTIYNGMPLRTEIRAFYNMDTSALEYMVDYWDYDYCYKNLHTMTDKVVFNRFHTLEHNCNILKYMNYIKENINTLKFGDKLTGVWSIDFMEYNNDLYLIDMARGFRSAYWDIDKLSSATKNKILADKEVEK